MIWYKLTACTLIKFEEQNILYKAVISKKIITYINKTWDKWKMN